jgi:hypothetical protein
MRYVTFTGALVVLVSVSVIDVAACGVVTAAFDTPATAALVQANVDPPILPVIVYACAVPLHNVFVAALVTVGAGFTVTT